MSVRSRRGGRGPRGPATALALAVGLVAHGARSGPCEPARIVAGGPLPGSAWERALEDLTAVVSERGHLWSCAGGELRVDGDDDGVLLQRRDARGRQASRRVHDAGDLVATAEALLALSTMPEADRPSLPDRPAEIPPASPAPAAPAEPRLVIEALGGARYGGAMRAVWGTGTLRVAVPFDAWSIGVWGRYALPYVFDAVPADFSTSDLGFGLSLARRLVAAPVELTATLDPSLAVVMMEGGVGDQVAQGARVDFRIGAGLRAAFPFTRTWRGVLAIDGELAPAQAAKAHRIDPTLPPIPAYSVGASLGVGAAIR